MTNQGADFYHWFGVDEALCTRVMGVAMGRGADYADLYFEHSMGSSVMSEDSVISRASSYVDRGVGIRVVVGDQTGYAFSEDLDEIAMCEAARTAASIAVAGGGAPVQGFRSCAGADLYPLREHWDEVRVDRKLPLLRRTEELARSLDPAVEKVTVSWANADSRVLILTSEGKLVTDRRPMARLVCSVVANRGGERQSNSANVAGRRGMDWFDEERISAMARDAVERTMVLYEARRPPAGQMPVVLAAGASGILLHEAVGHGMEADFNRKGTSIYSSMMGEKVAPDSVTIVDSALHPFERGALNIDDEGNPTQRTVLVEDGVMRSYLHDRISAEHYGVEATGSGRRESFRHVPMPRMRCTYMESGPHSRDEIIAAVDHGIVAETFTNGQVQIGAGDFTFYIKNGWLIENGRITAPIKDVNIIGNGPEAIRNISMVGDDMKLDTGGWTCGKEGQRVPVSQGMPTVLVSHLTVGGEDA
ncbi:MAG: peptidase U62 [Rickettsiales bacterium]|nr:peptidase U62 [Rickettsiales bacterium]